MSKREVMAVDEKINFWCRDIENAKMYLENQYNEKEHMLNLLDNHIENARTDLENQCREKEHIYLENQERKRRISNVSTALEELNEIKESISVGKEEFMKFYHHQRVERQRFYENLSPRLESCAYHMDRILLKILPPVALNESNKCHYTRIFPGGRRYPRNHPYK